MKKGKGSSFERQICKQLSLWWTHGKSDDVFWRTSTSGARATRRSKKGAPTFGQHGDIQATDPQGQPFIDVCSVELKRGYSKDTFSNLVEPSTHTNPNPCLYETFIRRAIEVHKNSKSGTWMLIIKRDRREALVLIPWNFYSELKGRGASFGKLIPRFYLHCRFQNRKVHKIFGTTLKDFLKVVHPKHIKDIEFYERL